MSVPFPDIKVETQYVKFLGGLDLETPVLSLEPGALLDGMNHQPRLFGGYERIDPFERFDGRAAPSDATYWYGVVQNIGDIVAGQSVYGGTSGATAVVSQVFTTAIELTKVTGTFVAEELLTRRGGLPLLLTMTQPVVSVGQLSSAPVLRGRDDGANDAVARNAAADIYRADVDLVPGSGSILGGHLYKGINYVFRNNAAGTAAEMWKQTSTGWQKIEMGYEISFTGGNETGLTDAGGPFLAQTLNGTIVSDLSVTIIQDSASSPNLSGKLIITGASAPSFIAGAAYLGVGAVATMTLTLTGPARQIALLPSGRYEFDNYNFSGSTDTLYMYGADGVNRGFEFDGTTLVPIDTGMAVNTPVYVKGHKNQLFFSFRGSSQNSGAGFPHIWTTVTGANEIGVGDAISGYSTLPGEALAITSRNSLRQLTGSTIDDFQLKNISDKRGTIPRTLQEMGQTYCLDDQGIVQVSPANIYGNFAEQIVSRRAQAVMDRVRTNVIASTVYRHKNQYRLYCSDGTGAILAVGVDRRGNPLMQITEFDYNAGRTTNLINPTCVWSGEDTTGKDVVFFGADNGYVYQCEKGTSFDGEEIESYLRLPFGDAKSPRVKKHYRKVVMEMQSSGYTQLQFHPEGNYGNSSISTHTTETKTIEGQGAYWGSASAVWSQFFYDAQTTATPEFKIGISARNLSLLFYNKSDFYDSHKIDGAIIYYSPRKLVR